MSPFDDECFEQSQASFVHEVTWQRAISIHGLAKEHLVSSNKNSDLTLHDDYGYHNAIKKQ